MEETVLVVLHIYGHIRNAERSIWLLWHELLLASRELCFCKVTLRQGQMCRKQVRRVARTEEV